MLAGPACRPTPPLLAERRRQLERALLSLSPGLQLPPPDLSDEELVDGLSQRLPLEPAHRQELLEADGPVERALRLIRRLRENNSRAAQSGVTHRALLAALR